MNLALERRVKSAGANLLCHPGERTYVQFSTAPTPAGLDALRALFAERDDLWLRVYGWGQTRDLEYLRALPTARRVLIDHGPIEDWRGLDGLSPELDALEVGENAGRTPLEAITARTTLRALALRSPVAAKQTPWLARLVGLTRLELSRAPLAKPAALFSSLPSLAALHLSRTKLSDLGALSPLRALTRLTLTSVTGFADLAGLDVPSLRELTVRGGGLAALSGLARSEGLREFTAVSLGVSDLAPVTALASLERLSLNGGKALTALPDMSSLTALRWLSLHALPPAVRDLAPVARAPGLVELGVSTMRHLTPNDFAPLCGHPTLQRVSVHLGSQTLDLRVRALLGHIAQA